VCLSVCLFALNSGTGRVIDSKFSGKLQGIQGMVLGIKNWGSWIESQKIYTFGG